MAEFLLSAFADEAAPDLDTQIEALKESGVSMIELRNVDGVSCADLTVEDARRIADKLAAEGITLSALGSPFGKIGITDPFEPHLKKFQNALEVCKIFNCSRIRMFSFYIPEGEDPADYRAEVMSRLETMITLAEEKDILLVHENEKGIYGDTDDRCLDLYQHFHGRLGVAFDPANYLQCGVDPKSAYEKQRDTITYFHMKDAIRETGDVVRVGHGDGSVPFILTDAAAYFDGPMILTVEPHLFIFSGLEKLQGQKLHYAESYPDSRTAFRAAVEAVKECIQ